MAIKYAETGRRTFGADKVHLESVHPDVRFAVETRDSDLISVVYGDTPSIDAFNRLRVSNPVGLWDSQLQYDLHRVLWEDQIDSVGTAAVAHDADISSATLTVEAEESIVRQTRQYFRYQPGKSHLVFVTFVFEQGRSGLTQRAGYYDDDNGFYFESVGSVGNVVTINMVKRSNITGTVVNSAVSQTSWNLDAMNGSGPSGITLDFSKAQILVIDMEWLGVGRVRTGFVVDGIIYYVHEFNHANLIASVYMTTANLPIRYEIIGNGGLTNRLIGSATLTAICSQVSSEGGFELSRGLTFAATNGRTLRSAGTSYLPLISIRPKQTFNSITNRGWIIPESASIFSEDQSANFQVIFGGTLTGASFNSVNADSVTEFDIAASAISGGIILSSDYVGATNQTKGSVANDITSKYPLFLDIDGNHPTTPYTDVLTLAVASLTAQSTDCTGAIQFREIR